jgi:uncharacterized protein with PIN domain
VIALLRSRTAEALCAACLSQLLDVPHKSAHEAVLKLEAVPTFRRHYARCSSCGKTRIVAEALWSGMDNAPDAAGADRGPARAL